MFSRFRLLTAGIVILLVAVIGVAAAACGDDDDADAQDGITQEQLDAVALDAQRGHVLATMMTFRTEGLHTIDEDSQTASEFEAGWSGSITRMRQATAGTNWPADLAEGAAELQTQLTAAEDAIADEDLAAFKTTIADAHAAWHELEHSAWAFIAGEEHSGDDGHGDENEGDDHEEGEDHDATDAPSESGG